MIVDFETTPANKGKSLIATPSDYVLLDLETTGLNPEQDAIIELGAIKVINHKLRGTFVSLVKPPRPIPPFITQLTGISNGMVQGAPTINKILPEFLEFIGDDLVMGHNVGFDIGFLFENCRRFLHTGFTNDYVDTLRLSRRLFPEERHHRLRDLEQRFGLHNENAHRALSDVMLTKGCYDAMRAYMDEHGITAEELQKPLSRRKLPTGVSDGDKGE